MPGREHGVGHRKGENIMSKLKVAYSGIEGSFASIAAGKIYPDEEFVSCKSFDEAYAKVVDGTCDVAVLPIENSFAGEVGQVMDLIYAGDLEFDNVYELSVSHCLLGTPNTKLENIKTVLSHPQALEQCHEFIEEHNLRTVPYENTARAARQVSFGGDPEVGAIASKETAELYGLKVLATDVNQSANNVTRFAVLSAKHDKTEKPDCTSALMFTVKNVAGGLVKALSIIGDYGFNMRVIRSRPEKKENWTYYFYVEVEGDLESERGRDMLKGLKYQCQFVKIVGRYESGLCI